MSELEALLLAHIRAVGLPAPLQQYRFDPERKWRADFAWPDAMLLAECDGATWIGGRHVSGVGYERDAEKGNAAALLGWRVLHFTRRQIESGYAVSIIEKALHQVEQ